MNKIRLIVISALILIAAMSLGVNTGAGQDVSQLSGEALLQALQQASGGEARVSYHAATGKVRFIGTTPDRPIHVAGLAELGEQPSPRDAARAFLATYGRLFGLRDQASELSVMKERVLEGGRAFVRFQQRYADIPVFGGELVVQLNNRGQALSANGEILPDINLNTTPTLDAATVQAIAIERVAKEHGVDAASLLASEPALWVYHPALLDAPGPAFSALVWRMEVTPASLYPVRQLVLVDAHRGAVVLSFNQIHTAKDRDTYTANNSAALPGTLVRSEGQGASGNADVDLAHNYAGDTYDFFFNEHGRDSLDDAGMTLISTVDYCPNPANCPYENAFWNGQQMAYGDGFPQADDVVGHELAHGVTDFSSHLFYYYQSGAINESLSDVWGEFIDQTNSGGSDTPADKWLMGEDVPGFGAIRDMQDPTTFGDPDRIGSPNYYCGDWTGDLGGVHINSGVNNKAVFLMTDGGSFNGQTVTGLGISKVADLYYEAQTNMLVSGSNYQDLYDILVQAGLNLGYSATDRQQIQKALNAVEMNQRPCEDPEEAPVCPSGQVAYHLYFDNLEIPGSGNWTSAAIVGVNVWYYPQNTHPYTGFDATYASSGIYNLFGDNPFNDPGTPGNEALTDSYIAMTDNVAIPANAFMRFEHSYGFENDGTTYYDGGVVEYTTNNGGSWNDAGSLFTNSSGYKGVLEGAFGNPLAGKNAFVADSQGYTASRLNLASLAGNNVRFRFRIGGDTSVGDWGWFIDDVRIYTCDVPFTPTEFVFLPSVVK